MRRSDSEILAMPTAKPSATGECLQCKQRPGRPKFCSQSCAATYNNRENPKRRPQGKCVDCGAAIATRHQRCERCNAKRKESQQREALNYQTFRSPAGQVRDITVQETWVHESVVFEPQAPGGRSFNPRDTCGEFLDALLGLIFAKPAYIRHDDISRYASWVDAFRSYTLPPPGATRSTSLELVASLPLNDLRYCLFWWIQSILRADDHPLFPTLALDAALFIEAHARGRSWYGGAGKSWRIPPLVKPGLHDPWSTFDSLDSATLKREITQRIRGLLVRCIVLDGGTIPGYGEYFASIVAGSPFVFCIDRCHLSQSNACAWGCVRAEEHEPPRFDIAADLCFEGEIILDRSTRKPVSCLTERGRHATGDTEFRWSAEVPMRWISGVYEFETASRAPHLTPVPQWDV